MSSVETHQLPDYYSVLKADPLAKIEQIEDLFRQLATEAQDSGDHSNIPQIIEAFETLRDPAKRQQYDHKYFALAQAKNSQQETATTPTSDSTLEPSSSVEATAIEPTFAEPTFAEPTSAEPTSAEQESPQQPSSDVSESDAAEAGTEAAAEEPFADGFGAGDVLGELKLKTEALHQHRRELLKIFYERRRKDVRKSGIAIGGLDSLVRYSYELLEFHLWIMSESKLITREESGALSISALGCEKHEQNLTDGLIESSVI